MHKGDCILPNSNKNKKRVVLGITLGGILIIAVALIVGIVVHRKKFRRKDGVAAKSSGIKQTKEYLIFRNILIQLIENVSSLNTMNFRNILIQLIEIF